MRAAVPAELAGQRADKVVARLFDLSRTAARRLIESGGVRVSDHPIDPADPLEEAVELSVELPPDEPGLVPEPVSFDVVYEDKAVAVVDKPAGLVVHPGAGRRRGTLAAGLLHRWPDLEGVGDEGRWGIVHRLDRETSGLLLVARTADAHRSLRRALEARDVGRGYLSLVHGLFEAASGTIEAPIGRDPSRPTRRAVVGRGRRAVSRYRVLRDWKSPDMTLVAVDLETGRTHQIRVHMAAIGHPVVGDTNYGRPGPPGVDPGRVWLHAARLRFDHPVTGEEVEVESDLPADLRSSLETLRRAAAPGRPADSPRG